jgi:hypothetical protein
MQSGDAPSSAMSGRFVGDGRLRLTGRCDACPRVGDRRRKDALNATVLIGRGLHHGQLSTETGVPWIGMQGRPCARQRRDLVELGSPRLPDVQHVSAGDRRWVKEVCPIPESAQAPKSVRPMVGRIPRASHVRGHRAAARAR